MTAAVRRMRSRSASKCHRAKPARTNVSTAKCYDEVLFHGLEDYVVLKGDGVIVLHTIGSHGPAYYNRYPPRFKNLLTPTCDTNSKEFRTVPNSS